MTKGIWYTMKPSKINRSVIQVIVKRAIHQLQDNPEREIRNLVDLGGMFAKGEFQRTFFDTAGKELEKENSAYYEVVKRLVCQTDYDALFTFGMNFGYNSLTHGAYKIREFENDMDFNVPWTIFIRIKEEGLLDAENLTGIIEQGKAMGIFNYTLLIERNYSKMAEIANMMAVHNDCAFILPVAPEEILYESNIASILALKNIFIGLNIRDAEDGQLAAAIKLLREKKILCAAFYPMKSDEQIAIDEPLKQASASGFELLFILQDGSFYLKNPEIIQELVYAYRKDPSMPVIPFDLLSDVLSVDRSISTEGCLAFISEEGVLSIVNMETGEKKTGYNIIDTSLSAVFGDALSKSH